MTDAHPAPRTQPAPVLQRSSSEREYIAEMIAEHLHGPMTALGIIFLLVVVGQTIAHDGSVLSRVLDVTALLLWFVFVTEFVARLVIAPSTAGFLKRNWWQIIFLVVPFLRFLRIVQAVRLARAGRIVSSVVRTGRSARHELVGRAGWVAATSLIIILGASQLLYEFVHYESYAAALHDTAYAVISAEPIGRSEPFAQALELVLATYSIVVFAALAAMLGAYFLRKPTEVEPA